MIVIIDVKLQGKAYILGSHVTAGILTSGFPLCYFGACARGPSHWSARYHLEIISSFSSVL